MAVSSGGLSRDPQVLVYREMSEVFRPCRIVAMSVVRDERALAGAVQQYENTKRRLEDLVDLYAAQLAAGKRPHRKKVRITKDRIQVCIMDRPCVMMELGQVGSLFTPLPHLQDHRFAWMRTPACLQVRVVGPLLGPWAAALYGSRPVRVDELLHLRTQLQAAWEQLQRGLEREQDLPYMPTAFVTFRCEGRCGGGHDGAAEGFGAVEWV